MGAMVAGVRGPPGFSAKYEGLFAQSRFEDSRSISALLNILLAGCWSLNLPAVVIQQQRCVAFHRPPSPNADYSMANNAF